VLLLDHQLDNPTCLRFYYEDDDAAETDRLEHALVLAERWAGWS
jgi:hypothetical protein